MREQRASLDKPGEEAMKSSDARSRAEEGGGSAPPPSSKTARLGAEPPKGQPSYAFLVVISVLSLAADLGSKAWAKSRLEDAKGAERRISVLFDHISLVFAKNRGGAWGLLQDESESVRRPFFLLISAAAIVFIFSLYRRLNRDQTALKWGLPLVLGGALGNLVDRIRYGHVIDFIDVRLTSTYHWPTFNVADIAICVGVGLMAVDMFTSRKSSRRPTDESAASPDDDDEPHRDSKPDASARAAAEDRAEGA
jgi:signal peptidase II